MKKYYCPYCGNRSLRIGQKINIGITFTNSHRRCANCGKVVLLKQNRIIPIALISMFISLIVSIIFKSYIIFALFILAYVLYDVVSILFSKFVKSEDADKYSKKYLCSLKISSNIKFPQMYFSGNSVLVLSFVDTNKEFPVIIEPISFNAQECRCNIAFIHNENIDEFISKRFALTDNLKLIASGNIVGR